MFLPIGDNVQHRSFPLISCLLIITNVVVFISQLRMVFESEGDPRVIMEFTEKFALNPVTLADGKVLGVLTHMFLHGGVMHLLGNMVVLWAFACSLEMCLGSACFLAFYIFWGVAAGLTEVFLSWGVDAPMVGASGAIAGCIGAYTVMFGAFSKIKCLVFIGFHPLTFYMPATVFGLLWIGGQLLDASNDPDGLAGIAWFAHIGGFCAGALTMWLFRNSTDQFVVTDSDGAVSLERRVTEEERQRAEQQQQLEAEQPRECPYCCQPLDEARAISAGMYTCANPNCGRLVYTHLNEPARV